MGTKVQHKIHLPCHFPVRDLNEEPRSSWTLYRQDEKLTSQLYDDIKPFPVDRLIGYDKEMLRRTMLEHEAIFQKQVHELHRLYRIQKDLMIEHKNQLLKLSGSMEASSSSIVSSQMPPRDCTRLRHVDTPSERNYQTHCVNISDIDDSRAITNFGVEGLSENYPFSGSNGRESGSTTKLGLKRTFDLRLPAEVYIETDEKEKLEKENVKSLASSAGPYNNVNLAHFAAATNCNYGNSNIKPDMDRQVGLPTHILTDLNEPVNDLSSIEVGITSKKCDDFTSLVHNSQNHQDLRTPNTSALCGNFLGQLREQGSSSNCLTSQVKSEIGQEKPVQYLDSEQNKNVLNPFRSGFCTEKYPMSTEAIQMKFKEPTYYFPEKNQRYPWLQEKNWQAFDSSRSPNLADSYCSRPSATQVMNSPSVVAHETYPTTLRATSRKVEHIPIAVQALPCFGDSTSTNSRIRRQNAAAQSKKSSCNESQQNGDLLISLSNTNKSSSGVNGIRRDFSLGHNASDNHLLRFTSGEQNFNTLEDNLRNRNSEGCGPTRYLRDLNLNPSTNELHNDVGCRNESSLAFCQSNGKLWYEKLPNSRNEVGQLQNQMDLGFTKSFTQLLSIFDKAVPESAMKYNKGNASSDYDPQSTISFSLRAGEPDVANSNESFRAHNHLQSSNYLCFHAHSTVDNNLPHKNEAKGAKFSRFRNDINLNSALVPTNDWNLSVMSSDGNENFTSSRKMFAKKAPIIDLEAPPSELDEGNSSLDMFTDIDQNKKTTNNGHESEAISDVPVRIAAYTIFSLSKDACESTSHAVSCHPESATGDSLHWFAEVVISKGKSETDTEVPDKESDLFESMTLKLEEVRDDDYWHRSCVAEIPQDDDEKWTASLPFTKPKRGRTRKRRQQKNFQKDILPTISLLSQHEVTEDLHAFGGLMKFSAEGRQAGSKRRRNTLNGQGRGRRRQRISGIVTEEAHVNSLQLQVIDTEVRVTENTMQGWGRKTRRCRTQRVSTSNSIALHN